MTDLRQRIREAHEALRRRLPAGTQPDTGIILGTGLGQLGHEIEDAVEIPYTAIPHFPTSTVESHDGSLIVGSLEGRTVAAMKGRLHLYEGYRPDEVTFGVRVMERLGITSLLVSNAAGGLNPAYEPGDLMIIDDHINLTGLNPLVGINHPELGQRFPDMSAPYDRKLAARAQRWVVDQGGRCHLGVYAGVLGPCLETRAEYRFLRGIGADVVGMSTVPEVIVAVQCGLRILGVSIVTDRCIPETLRPVDISEVIAVAVRAEPQLTSLTRHVLRELLSARAAPDAHAPEAGALA